MQTGHKHLRDPLSEALFDLRKVFMGMAGFSLFTSLLMLTGPIYMLQVYDRVLASGSVSTLVGLTLLILVLYISLGALDWVRGGVLSASASRFEDVLGNMTLSASLANKLKDPGKAGDKPLRDLRTLRRFVSGPAIRALFDAPYSLIFFIILFLIHWSFGVLAVFGAAVLVGIAWINQRSSQTAMVQAEQLEQAAQMRVREITENAEVIEALGMREQLQTKWRDEFDRSDAAIVGSGNLLGGFVAGTKAFRMFLQSGVLGLGAYLTIIGASTAGAMIAASIITGRAIAPLEQLVGQWRSVTLAREAWTALRDALLGQTNRTGQMELPPVAGHLVCEHVSAGPPGAKKPFLKDIHFAIEPGDVLGIIGPSAAGKSTLARILAGVWPAQVGAVRVDGAEMSAWSRTQLGPQLGYLPQRVDLFSGTIRDNIARFQPGISDEHVIMAAKAAGCHDMILRLADGYDTEIGHSGAYLSAGQRQRIGLARAMFGTPAIVIMDEPNANLDNRGDVALQTAIAALKTRGATTIIIAHRPNAIAQCNKLLMLEDGRVRAFGPRDEVLAKVAPKQAGARVTPIRKGDANG